MTAQDIHPITQLQEDSDEILKLASKVLSLIRDNPEACDLVEEISRRGKRIKDSLTNFLRDYDSLIDAISTGTAKETDLYRLVDEQYQTIPHDDKKTHRICCEKEFNAIWNLIDEQSKEFLIATSYISEAISAYGTDYSPAILEMGRAVENELRTNLFDGFVMEESGMELLPQLNKDDPLWKADDLLRKAVKKYRATQTYYIPMKEMFQSFSKLNSGYLDNNYLAELSNYANNTGWTTQSLADQSFTKDGINYTNDYRNEAAHPSIMDIETANNCRNETISLLSMFFKCRTSLRVIP